MGRAHSEGPPKPIPNCDMFELLLEVKAVTGLDIHLRQISD